MEGDVFSQADADWMRIALRYAAAAAASGEVPVGAVLVQGDELLTHGENRRERDLDPTAHAEIVALRAAGPALQGWRLTGCTLYVTLEPCAMCAGAIVNARLDRVVFATTDPKAGAMESRYRIGLDGLLNHRVQVVGGVLAEEASQQLRAFFRERRAKQAPSSGASHR